LNFSWLSYDNCGGLSKRIVDQLGEISDRRAPPGPDRNDHPKDGMICAPALVVNEGKGRRCECDTDIRDPAGSQKSGVLN
jgi:hypothetical protein